MSTMADEIYQVFVKLLDGKSKALNFKSKAEINNQAIKHRIYILTGIPTYSQIIIYTKNKIQFPIFCTLIVRLRGGKGGFGSLLRGAATKAGQKKTNNFDACRDMSGRRLRHVNAEKRLEEWKAEAGERGLEKAADEFLRKKMKAEGKSRKEGGGVETEKYVSKYREDSARCMEVVEKSVREALGGKRKAKEGTGGKDSKKLKIWMGKRKVDNSDSDDSGEADSDDNEEQENENSAVLDNENYLDSNMEPEGSSDSVTGGKMDGKSSAGSSSENSSGGEETAIGEISINVESCGEAVTEETVQNRGVSHLNDTLVSETRAVKNDYVTVGQAPSFSSFGEGQTLECRITDAETSLDPVLKPSVQEEVVAKSTSVAEPVKPQEEVVAKSTSVADPVKPLNFEEFNSSAELEAIGMEKLKSELQLRGLKCGGTLQERAARLFLLKTTPLEKLPKKLLAKK